MRGTSNSKPGGAVLVLFETEHLKGSIRTALAQATLTPWQRNFLSDVLARLERCGSKTRLSDRQLSGYTKFSAVKVRVFEERRRNSERPWTAGASNVTHGRSCHERPHGGAGEFSATR
ncbi:hypothetical protein LZK76_33625 (plasmid) [Rhizobium leguminosarum]|nr:hypothetical protein LZK76_33625 [Rhizobium leguminosarum]